MAAMTPEQIEQARRATARAKKVIKPGDRISRTMCGGRKGTFVFTHWENDWMCGKSVTDCHAQNVYRVNGKLVSFLEDNNAG